MTGLGVQVPGKFFNALARSNKAVACLRDTVGKSSRKSSRLSPASRYSINMRTGTLVPAKTSENRSPPKDVRIPVN